MAKTTKRQSRPENAIRDLLQFIAKKGFRLSPAAEVLFRDAEQLGYDVDDVPMYEAFLCATLQNMPSLQALLPRGKESLPQALEILRASCDYSIGSYQHDFPRPYSKTRSRVTSTRTRVIDLAISCAAQRLRREVTPSPL
jgi:hypothetical protein